MTALTGDEEYLEALQDQYIRKKIAQGGVTVFAEEWDYDTALEVRTEEARMAAL